MAQALAEPGVGGAGAAHLDTFREVLEREVDGLSQLISSHKQSLRKNEAAWQAVVDELRKELAGSQDSAKRHIVELGAPDGGGLPGPGVVTVVATGTPNSSSGAKAKYVSHGQISTVTADSVETVGSSSAQAQHVSEGGTQSRNISKSVAFSVEATSQESFGGESVAKSDPGFPKRAQSEKSMDSSFGGGSIVDGLRGFFKRGEKSMSALSFGLEQLNEQNRNHQRDFQSLQDRMDTLDVKLSLGNIGIRTLRKGHHNWSGLPGASKSIGSQGTGSCSRSDASRSLNTAAGDEIFRPWDDWIQATVRTPAWDAVGMQNRDLKLRHKSIEFLDNDSVEKDHPFVISPNSRERLIWECFGMCFLMYDLVAIPLLVFTNDPGAVQLFMDWITVFFWTLDMLLSFRLGFYTKQGALILAPHRIAWHYLMRWFAFDFVITALDWFVTVGDHGEVVRSATVVRGLRLVRFFRLLRIIKITHLVNAMRLRVNSQYAYIVSGIIEYLSLLILINHLIACLWYWMGLQYCSEPPEKTCWIDEYGFRDASLGFKYIASFHWSLTQFTPASMQVTPQNGLEQFFAVVVLVVALVIFGSFISSITLAMTALRAVNARRADQFWLLRRYCRQHSISTELTMHVTRYLTIAVNRQKTVIQDSQVEILGLLSTPLRVRLKHELYSHILLIHPIFEYFSVNCVSVLNMLCCSAVQTDHLSKGDVLFNQGETALRMIFISEGRAIYVREETFTKILDRLQFCCEAVLWVPWMHRGEMVAKTECSVLSVVSLHFREVLVAHPAHVKLPRRYAIAFAKRLQEQVANGTPLSDIDCEIEEGSITATEFHKNIVEKLERERSQSQNGGTGSRSQKLPEDEDLEVVSEDSDEPDRHRHRGTAPGALVPSNSLKLLDVAEVAPPPPLASSPTSPGVSPSGDRRQMCL